MPSSQITTFCSVQVILALTFCVGVDAVREVFHGNPKLEDTESENFNFIAGNLVSNINYVL